MRPALWSSIPAIRLNRVLLPQPAGPTIDTKSPAATWIEALRRASTDIGPPKVLLTPSTSRSGLLKLGVTPCPPLKASRSLPFEQVVGEERTARELTLQRLVL